LFHWWCIDLPPGKRFIWRLLSRLTGLPHLAGHHVHVYAWWHYAYFFQYVRPVHVRTDIGAGVWVEAIPELLPDYRIGRIGFAVCGASHGGVHDCGLVFGEGISVGNRCSQPECPRI